MRVDTLAPPPPLASLTPEDAEAAWLALHAVAFTVAAELGFEPVDLGAHIREVADAARCGRDHVDSWGRAMGAVHGTPSGTPSLAVLGPEEKG